LESTKKSLNVWELIKPGLERQEGGRRAVRGWNGRCAVKVSEILAVKGSNVITIEPSNTIAELCRRLREKRIGAAVVTRDGNTEGMISERDVTYGLAVHEGELHTHPVSALMTKNVISCSPEDNVALVASKMLSNRIRHIPVLDNGRVIGMVSIRDVLNWRVSELQHESGMLRTFLSETERNPPADR
jgi:CBS domain-containing protein